MDTKSHSNGTNGGYVHSNDDYMTNEKPNGTNGYHDKTNGDPEPTSKKTEKKSKKEKKEKTPDIVPVGPLEYFQFSTCLERFMILIGTVVAMIHGTSMPLMVVIFGDVIDDFSSQQYINSTMADALAQVQNKSVLIGMTQEQTIQYLTDKGYMGFNVLDSMRTNAFYFIGIAAGVLIVGYLQMVLWMIPAQRQTNRIRNALFRSIMRQEIGWFDQQSSGELNNRLTDDVMKISEGMGDKAAQFFQWVATCITGLIVGFVRGWKLTLVVLALSPAIGISGFIFTKLTSTFANKELKSYGKAGSVAEEVLGAVRTVMAFGGDKKEVSRYTEQLKEARSAGIKRGLAGGLSMGAVWFIIFCGYALGFWYGGKLVRDNEGYSAGKIITIFFSVLIAAMAIGHAVPSLESFSSGRIAARTVYDIINRKSKINSSSSEGRRPQNVVGNIELKNVHFAYPTRSDCPVMKGFCIKIPAGKTVALVGGSGCGKSSTVNLIQRFYDPASGEVYLDGEDIRNLNVAWLRSNIGIVSQEPVLFHTSIGENIRYGRMDVTQADIERACKMANAADFIELLPLKYDTLVGDRGTQLSGGQKQRIAIARALVRNPKILLLDEATSALDTESESIVQSALDKAREGRTTIVVAHRLSTIRTADYIAGIADGVVKEIGTHDELMARGGIYHTLCTNQQTVVAAESGVKKELPKDDESDDEILEKAAPKTRAVSIDVGNRRRSTNADRFDTINLENDVVIKPKKKGCFPKKKKTAEEEEDEKLPPPSFGRLMSLNKSEWPFIVLGCIGAICNGGVQPAFAIVFSEVITVIGLPDLVEQERQTNLFAGMFVVCGAVGFLSNFVQSFCFAKSGEELTMRVRHLMFQAMLRQDMSWFDDSKNNLGALTTRLSTEATHIQYATGSRLGGAFQAIASLGVGIIIAFVFQWKLAFVILAFVPFIMLGGLLQVTVMKGSSHADKSALEKAGKISVEGIENIRTVVSLGREDRFEESYSAELVKPLKIATKKVHLQGFAFSSSMCVIFLCYAATFYFSAVLLQNNEVGGMGDIFKVFGALVFGAMAVGQATGFAGDAGKAGASASRLFALLDRVPTISDDGADNCAMADEKAPLSVVSFHDGPGEVKLENVAFRYPTRPNVQVLRGVSFTTKPGESLALVGSSGCGKSTIIQLIERFYDPLEGIVMINGKPSTEQNPRALRTSLGIVQQEPVLFGYSIRENIAYGDLTKDVTMDEIITAARQSNIHSFIEGLPEGYETLVGEKGCQLSGGQKQRIAIARALVRNPKVLLLDEATSALDTESEKIVQEALDRAQEGRTSIVIAHRLSTIKGAQTILVFAQGKIREVGSHDSLMSKKGIYYNLVCQAGGQPALTTEASAI